MDSGKPGGNVEAVTVKMHEPNLVAPVATAPPEPILKAGVSPVLVKATVVGLVVPSDGTPEGKTKGVLTTAAVVLATTLAATLDVDVKVVNPPELLPPPPQAARAAVTTAASMNFEVLNIVTLSLNGYYKNSV